MVGNAATSDLLLLGLRQVGFTVLASTSWREALEQAGERVPDLVVMRGGDMTGRQLVRQLRVASDEIPPVVVIGRPGFDDPRWTSEADDAVGVPAEAAVAELVDRVRARLDRRRLPPALAARRALAEQELIGEVGRESQLSETSGRPGALAAISVAERRWMRTHLSVQAEMALATALDEAVVPDAQMLEQHSAGPDGMSWLLMPETGVVEAHERLTRLSQRLARTVLDVEGEQVRFTPVVGYADFSGSAAWADLRDRALAAHRSADLHLDLIPVGFTPALIAAAPAPVLARERLTALMERLRSPLQVIFTSVLLVALPFMVYVLAWGAGFDLTRVTYPLVALALAGSAAAIWLEGLRAIEKVDPPDEPATAYPRATAIVAAYLPNEAATICETITTMLAQEYPGELQVILAYNAPRALPVEQILVDLARDDPRLLVLRVDNSTSKAQNVNAALAHVRGEFVGIFDADHHPAPGSFARAWRWLSHGHDVVQGHCVVRNGDASWVARLVAIEFEAIYAVSHPGRARLHRFGIFGGSNGYWRHDRLRQIRMQGSMLTEDIDSSMRSLRDGASIVSDPTLSSSELAPTTLRALWHQRLRWAQGWTQTAKRHLGPALASDRLTRRQKAGAGLLLGWAQIAPWVTIQVIPILAFAIWREGGVRGLNFLVPLFVWLTLFTLSSGVVQAALACVVGDERIRRRRSWFVLYAVHSVLWFGEYKNLIARVAQLKELFGERAWRVTPRGVTTAPAGTPAAVDRSERRSVDG